ncbi:MAG: hypothetical protein RR247_02645 [Clostridia bacterium]
MAIYIIFAPPRTGKTCFMTHILNGYAFDRERNKSMKNEIISKNQHGFNLSLPKHCVSSNYDISFKKYGYTPRYNRRINPYKLGFNNEFVKTHFNYPFEVIGITEAQKYLNSRMSMYFPEWQSRWYEQHGHDSLDIYLDTQRPMLIDVNIRELAQFIEIVKLKLSYDEFGSVKKLKWTIRKIDNSSLFDRYMASGKKEKSCYAEETVVANYNVFKLYSSQSQKPKFYAGHFDEDFDIQESKPIEDSMQGYIKYLEENDDEMPVGYYQSKTIKRRKESD